MLDKLVTGILLTVIAIVAIVSLAPYLALGLIALVGFRMVVGSSVYRPAAVNRNTVDVPTCRD